MSRALVLLQAHRRHAHWHLPYGDARSPTSNDIIEVRGWTLFTSTQPSSSALDQEGGPFSFSFSKNLQQGTNHKTALDGEPPPSSLFFSSSVPSTPSPRLDVFKQWIRHAHGSVLYLVKNINTNKKYYIWKPRSKTSDNSGLKWGRTEDKRNILSHCFHHRFSYTSTRKSWDDQVLTHKDRIALAYIYIYIIYILYI